MTNDETRNRTRVRRRRRATRAAIRIVAGAMLMIALHPAGSAAQANAVTQSDTVRAWYDTLEVTRPRFARATFGERLALAGFTALALPVGLVVGGLTILPPTVNLLHEHGETNVGLTIGTGWGFGGDTTRSIYFPDARMQFDVGYYPAREHRIMGHATLIVDARLGSIHARDFAWLGVSGGGGVATDLSSLRPFAEAWIGVMNPMGIRYAPLFPMHNYGVRGRYGYDPVSDRPWFEIAIGATSTFGF